MKSGSRSIRDVRIWFERVPTLLHPAVVAELASRLTPREAEELSPAKARGPERFVARALLRTVLAWERARAPQEARFEMGRQGRPFLVREPGEAEHAFSVSHTRGLVACALGGDRNVGLDVEDLSSRACSLEVASLMFAPGEAAAVERAQGPARQATFFDLWTLKESYLKARGAGLTLPTEQVCFERREGRLEVAFGPAIADDPARWQFSALSPAPGWAMALCAHLEPGEAAVPVRLRRLALASPPLTAIEPRRVHGQGVSG